MVHVTSSSKDIWSQWYAPCTLAGSGLHQNIPKNVSSVEIMKNLLGIYFLTYTLYEYLSWERLICADLSPVFNRYWMNIKQRIQHLTWWMRVQTNGTRSSCSPIRSFDTTRDAGHSTHHVMHHVTNHVTNIIQSDSTKEHICTIFFKVSDENNSIYNYFDNWIYYFLIIDKMSKSNFVSDAFLIDDNWRMVNYLYKIVKKNS